MNDEKEKRQEYTDAITEYLESEFPDLEINHGYDWNSDAEWWRVFFKDGPQGRFLVRHEELDWFTPETLIEALRGSALSVMLQSVAPEKIYFGHNGIERESESED